MKVPMVWKGLVGLVLAVFAVFGLPFLLGPEKDISASNMVGFNNHVALVGLLAGSLLFAWWMRGLDLHLEGSSVEPKLPLWKRADVYWVGGVLFATAVIGLKMWRRSRLVQPIGEATYFLDRYSMYAAGGRLYRDFSFDYGPLLFYPSVWLSRLFHLQLGNGYFVTWLVQWIAGLTVLWVVLRALRAPMGDRILVFMAVALAWLTSIIDGGANYTPLRFIASSGVAVLVVSVYRRRGRWPATLTAMAGFALLFFYSTEQGFSFAAATLLYFGVCLRDRRNLLPAAVFVAWCAVVLKVGLAAGVMRSLLTFGGGDYNLPFLLSIPTLSLTLGLIAAAFVVIAAFYRGRESELELYLIALALCATPAAFGRADPGHVFINTMPAVMVATLALLQFKALSRMLAIVAWCLYIQAAYMTHFYPGSATLRKSAPDGDLIAARDLVDGLRDQYPNRKEFLAPFGFPVEVNVTARGPVQSGQFFGYGLVSRQLPAAKVAELAAKPQVPLVVPWNYEHACDPAPAIYIRTTLRDLFLPMYLPDVVRAPDVAKPLCTYIQTHYHPWDTPVNTDVYQVLLPNG